MSLIQASFVCQGCLVEVARKTARQKYCSDGCRYKVRDSSPDVKSRQASQKRSAYARALRGGERPVELLRYDAKSAAAGVVRRVAQSATCVVGGCGRVPLALSKCQKHYRAQRRAEGVPWANEGSGRFKARARRFGVTYEPINRFDVFERDGWLCGICGGPVSREDASIDHILPISKGGPHTLENVQCAHLLCNSKKGARVD